MSRARGKRAAADDMEEAIEPPEDEMEEVVVPPEGGSRRLQQPRKQSKKAKVEHDGTESEDDEEEAQEEEDEHSLTKDAYPYIKRVKLSNFMCHNNFTTDFIKEINFIGGENGTGKSAILAAIAFGLGSRAEATGRAHSLKDFVGPHDERATVEVHLVQSSIDRFPQQLPQGVHTHTLPEEFIVERSVWKTGRNEIKIMDRNRKALSIKKADLDAINKHLNYQVDNPAVVLTQKTAKEFLTQADPKGFYQLFLRATQIDQIEEKIREATNILEDILTVAEREQESFEFFKENKLAPAVLAYEDMQAARELHERKKVFNYEMCSWQYKTWTKKMEELEKEMQKQDDKKARIQAKIVEEEEGGQSSRERVAELKAEVEMQQQRAQKPTVELAEVDKRLRAKKKERTDRENAKKTLKREIDNLNGDIADVRKRMRDQIAQADALQKKKNPERPVSRMPEFREKLEALKDKLSQKIADKEQFDAVDRDKKKQYEDAAQRLKIIDDQIKAKQSNVNRLENVGKGNSLARFGNDVPAIAAAFKAAEKQFSPGQAPVGPVGAYVKMKDPKWGLALCDATSWNKGGQTWLVHSIKDLETCRKILKDKRLNTNDFQVCTLNPDDFDPKIGAAPEPSILDVIEIDHPNKDCARYIRNFLIDSFRINELRLTEDVMAGKAVVERPIETVVLSNGVRHELKRTCYSLNSQGTAVERVQTATKTGGLSASYIASNRANPYETDVSAQRALAQQELAGATQERGEHQHCFDIADREKKASFRDVAAVTKEVQSIQKDIDGLENAMRNEAAIQAKWKDEDADEQDQEIRALRDISGFEEEEQQMKRQIESKTDEMKGIDIATTKMKEEEQEFEAEKQVVERKRLDILRELKDAEKMLQAELEGASTRNEKIDGMRAMIAKHQAKWNEAQTELAEQTRLRTEFVDAIPSGYNWKEKGPLASDRDKAEIEADLAAVDRQLKAAQKNRSLVNVEAEWRKAKQDEKRKEFVVKELDEVCKLVQKALKRLKKQKRRSLKQNKTTVMFSFNRNLTQKDMTGMITFDEQKKTMEPIVHTQKVDENDAEEMGKANPVKNLSGGERSFATLCLVLALKEATQTPFLALDEFDVFMDERNRKVSLMTLVQVLKNHGDSQTIIISPLSLDAIDPGEGVKKIRLKPVDRNQRALPFAAAAGAP